MKIFRVMGLGLAIIMLKFLVPRLFTGFENTLLVFFDTLQKLLAGHAGALPASVPHVPGI